MGWQLEKESFVPVVVIVVGGAAVAAIDVSRASLWLYLWFYIQCNILQMFTPYTKWQARAQHRTPNEKRNDEKQLREAKKNTQLQFTKKGTHEKKNEGNNNNNGLKPNAIH